MSLGARVVLLLAFCAGLYACASGSDACGGPTSDFPYCGPNEDEGVDTPDDSGSGNGSAEPPDAGSNAGCNGPVPMCMDVNTTLSVMGMEPSGPVEVQGVALTYLQGDQNATQLRFFGREAEGAFAIDIVLQGAEGSAVASTGEYATNTPLAPLSSVIDRCGERAPIAVHVSVAEHELVSADGAGGHLKGSLEVIEAQWELTVPFEITQACQPLR